MKFLVYSEINADNISHSLGLPDYSYYFVLRDFKSVLEMLGEVIVIGDPALEVDHHYDMATANREACVFLSFTPPHNTCLGLRCPTIPVFAWEFDSIPNEHWLNDPRQDWCHVLKTCGSAITHSELTVRAVKEKLGADFPIISIPSPVWDRFSKLRSKLLEEEPSTTAKCNIQIQSGIILDTHDIALDPYMPDLDAVAKAVANARSPYGIKDKKAALAKDAAQAYRRKVTRTYLAQWFELVACYLNHQRKPKQHVQLTLEAAAEPQKLEPRNQVEPVVPTGGGLRPRQPLMKPNAGNIELSGVVFTSLFNPYDGRKNWVDMLTAFCEAFRNTPDATLVLKLGHHEYQDAINGILMCIARLPAFQCRVVIIHGYLEKAEFEALIGISSFVVNTSHGEGQCLPLMEFMSCGKPAVAPLHSAMLDYIDGQVAFLMASWLDATAWPQDPRLAYRTCRHQIDWSSLVAAYRAAYDCAKLEPSRYRLMSETAAARMQQHCSKETAKQRLELFLKNNVFGTHESL